MKFLASDFDNTIYFMDDEETNQKNVTAIRRFVKEGNKFCIVTGRNYTSIKQLLNEYSIPYHYLICEDGAKIFNSQDDCLDTTYLEPEMVSNIISLFKEKDYYFYLDDGYQKTDHIHYCVKVVVDCLDEDEKEKIVSFVKDRLDVHIYASRYHVNIINRCVNKKYALERLLKHEKIEENNLYVIGDNENDFEMLERFRGVVVKKHHSILDSLNKKEYDSLHDYIEELMKD